MSGESDALGLEAAIGHPLERFDAIVGRVQHENCKKFGDIAEDFLALMWCIDAYRVAGIPPRGMGKPGESAASRLSGAYRMKGSWFSRLVSLLLINQTESPLASRSKIQGFSQEHQIDVAWPVRAEPIRDPLVCVETKVMGAPAFSSTKARGATSDWTNRRKELKFQATDLKLFRRQHETQIDHWDNWRKTAPPNVYFLWCARMEKPKDDLGRMTVEVRALTETYLDGAAIFPYEENSSHDGYQQIRIAWKDRVVDLDDTLHRIANHINDLVKVHGAIPAPELPRQLAVDPSRLEADHEPDDDSLF